MENIVLASFNAHKCTEIAALLKNEAHIIPPQRIGYHEEPEENATTLEGNALIKARALHAFAGVACLADDTGLEVDALSGAPGVRSARFAGENHNDAANRALLLKQLEGVASPRRARFRTVIAYIDKQGEEHLFNGVVEGEIICEERGEGGFGYDSIFVPEGCTRTFGEMSEEEKNSMSHRARAVEQLANYLHQSS